MTITLKTFSTTPKIDDRDFNIILEEFKQLAPSYIPEWNISDQSNIDSGITLIKIFIDILEEVIKRLNQVPTKNFVEFINLIKTIPLPATPARVPVTAILSEGVKNDIFLPAGTKFETEANDRHPALTYESMENILVTRAKIVEIYSCIREQDEIYRYTENYFNKISFCLFAGENDNNKCGGSNLQEHILYLAHDALFNIKSRNIKITLYFVTENINDAQTLKDIFNGNKSRKIVSWEYGWKMNPISGKEIKDSAQKFLFYVTVDQNIVIVKLTKNSDLTDEIQRQKLEGIENRWIRCKLSSLDSIIDTLTQERFWRALDPPLIEKIGITITSDPDVGPDFLAHNDLFLCNRKIIYQHQ